MYFHSKESSRFKPHYNRAMGKKYYTKKDYLGDMKKMGLEPYDPSKVKKVESKPYQPSEKARRMISSLQKDKQGNYIVGDRYKDELRNMGMAASKQATDMKKELKDNIGRTRLNNMEGGYLDA